jgi:hypothetical protein
MNLRRRMILSVPLAMKQRENSRCAISAVRETFQHHSRHFPSLLPLLGPVSQANRLVINRFYNRYYHLTSDPKREMFESSMLYTVGFVRWVAIMKNTIQVFDGRSVSDRNLDSSVVIDQFQCEKGGSPKDQFRLQSR